jgi:membrane-associated protein
MLGAIFGGRLFDRPDGRIFNQQRVASTEKWLLKYGVGRALVLSRFIPVIRTLINPMAGITHISAKRFFLWNALGAVIWTELVLGIGYVVGEKLKGSVDKYLLPVVALIVVISFIPVVIEFFREWSTRKHHS